MANWGLKRRMIDWVSMLTYRYVNQNGVVMDVKWEPDSDNGWAVCGNDWTNVTRGLEFPVKYFEIVRDGWNRCPH